MRLSLAWVAALVLLAGCVTIAEDDPDAALAAAENSAARGGAAAVEQIRAVDLWVDIREGDMALAGHYRANRDGCMRIDILVGAQRVFTEAITAGGGWQTDDAGVTSPQSAAGLAALRHGIETPTRLFGLHEFTERGHKLTMIGYRALNGRNFVRIDAGYADGYSAEFYLSPDSKLIERIRDRRPYHPDIDMTARRVETRLSDYRPVEGVLFPFVSEDVDIDTQEALSTARVRTLSVNTEEALGICQSQPPAP